MLLKYNTRLIKARKSYTPQEIAGLFGISKWTCFRWLKSGLAPMELNTNPLLIMGSGLMAFLRTKQAQRGVKLRPDEYYCLKCRAAVKAKNGTEKRVKTGQRIGRQNKEQYKKVALCERCQTKINRFLEVSQKD